MNFISRVCEYHTCKRSCLVPFPSCVFTFRSSPHFQSDLQSFSAQREQSLAKSWQNKHKDQIFLSSSYSSSRKKSLKELYQLVMDEFPLAETIHCQGIEVYSATLFKIASAVIPSCLDFIKLLGQKHDFPKFSSSGMYQHCGCSRAEGCFTLTSSLCGLIIHTTMGLQRY